jgi:maltose alpha-D-glucosyltransferase/alpha-amylase
LWYKDAIIYELHVRAFADSNGDGIGDFPGLISRLDYLQDLGVTCIWLLPFFPSPLRDDGYDIANYVDVNPSYGTLNDFKSFLDAAHRRNMQVMIELVINHTSDQHPWFKAARLAPPGSPARAMYVWSSTDQPNKDARIIFTDTEKSNWTWDETAKAYYWHRFFSHQPDLNFDNPVVIEEILKAMRFWLDMGVDALRMDAIPYLVERDGTTCENLPETHKIIKLIRAAIDAEYANRLILAEANQWPADVRPYFGDGDECHMAFHFPLMPRIYMALRQEDSLPIIDIMAQTPAIPDKCQWGLFLRNHDELTLEMVTDDERDYMYFAYSADPRMRINVGIRRRLAPLVDNNRRRIELLNSLLLSFPGTPILYYGDEIGMGDNIYLGDRNGVRTPMQWNSDRNAGFSRCDPARLYFPVVMDPVFGYQVINVEAQLSDQSSLLHWTRNMIALRKLFQVFGRGSFKFLNPSNRKILAYLRSLDRDDGSHETVLCVANLSRFAQPVSLDLADYAGSVPVEMLGYVPFPSISKAPYALTLAPYSSLWLELQPAMVNVDFAQPEQQVAGTEETSANEAAAPELLTSGWSGFLVGQGLSLLESAIANWLPHQRWFGAKTRKILAARLLQWTELPAIQINGSIPAVLLFVQIAYAEGASDIYQLPVAFTMGTDAQELTAGSPQSILADLSSSAGPAVLHDATTRDDFRQSLLTLIERNAALPLSEARPASVSETEAIAGAPIGASPQPALPHLEARASTAFLGARTSESMASRVGSAEQSNTSILYGKQMILKLFRRLQPGQNPDVEIGRFLTDGSRFAQTAPFLGEISIASPNGEPTTIAMLQKLIANNGDGWQWFLNQLTDFFTSIEALPDPISAPPNAPPLSFLNEGEPAPDILQHARPSLEAAALLGRRTAELHLALASPTSDPAFAPEPFTHDDLDGDARRIDAQITSTLQALKTKLTSLTEDIADSVALLLSRRLELFARADAITSLTAAGQRMRSHGDYHLGQVLRTGPSANDSSNGAGDFVLLDFEGEPARPLAERRQKQSPLRDVAGMIRSLSYAARAGLNQYRIQNPVPANKPSSERLLAWALLWQNSVSSEFLRSYRETAAANTNLLPPPQDAQTLLRAYLLEKGMYELLYELNNRPDWLAVPLAGILGS